MTFELILEERLCHVASWYKSFPGVKALWPLRNREKKASREVKERGTEEEEVKSGIMKGPEGHCMTETGCWKVLRRGRLSLRFSTRINLAIVLRT